MNRSFGKSVKQVPFQNHLCHRKSRVKNYMYQICYSSDLRLVIQLVETESKIKYLGKEVIIIREMRIPES